MMRAINLKALFSRKLRTKLTWHVIEHELYELEASHNLDTWNISVNDYPEEDLYTLYINGSRQLDFNSWPSEYWGELPIKEFKNLLENKGFFNK